MDGMNENQIFRALADETRRRTLAVLGGNALTVSELVEVLRQPQSTVSRHLRVLREAGLIRDQRDGKHVLYALSRDGDSANGNGLLRAALSSVHGTDLDPVLARRLHAVIERRRSISDAFFSRVGQTWDQLRTDSFGPTFHVEAFLSLLPREWTVVDVGSGTGYLLPTLSRWFERVIAVEPVRQMREVAERRVSTANLRNVELREGDLNRLPVDDASCDLAVAILVLHHVPAPEEALAELHRVLRTSGRLLVVEQARHESEAFRERMQDRLWGFDRREFVQLAQGVGFGEAQCNELTTLELGADAPELFVVTATK